MQLSTQQPSLAEVMTQKANELYGQGATGNLGLSGQQLTSQIDTNIANQQQAVKNTQAINEAFSGYEGNVGFGLGGAALKNYQAQNANKLTYENLNSEALNALAQLLDNQQKEIKKAQEDAAKAAQEKQQKDLDRKIELAKAGLTIDENGNVVSVGGNNQKTNELISAYQKNYQDATDEGAKTYWKQQLAGLGVNIEETVGAKESEKKAQIADLAQQLLNKNIGSITGAIKSSKFPVYGKLISGQTGEKQALLDQLVSLLALEKTGELKGALNEEELKLAKNAATILSNPNISDKAAEEELKKLSKLSVPNQAAKTELNADDYLNLYLQGKL